MNKKNIGPNWQREKFKKEYKPEYSEIFKRAKRIFNKGRQVHSQGNIQSASLFSDEKHGSWDIRSEEMIDTLDCGCCINNDSDVRLKVINYGGIELIMCERCWIFSLCSLCGGFIGVDPRDRIWIDKKVYCKSCAEEILVKLLNHEKEYPGSIDHLEFARFKSQLALIRSERSRFWRFLYGISIKEVKRVDKPEKY